MMLRHIRFMADAVHHGVAYIDCDGAIMAKFKVPDHVHDKLEWWVANLAPTRLVYRRIAFLWILKCLGVDLRLWTNRHDSHRLVTLMALGRHSLLFTSMHFMGGRKGTMTLEGPVMDDEPRYLRCGTKHSLLVDSQ